MSAVILPGVKRLISFRPSDLREDRFFRDRLSLALITAALALNAINLIDLVTKLRVTDIPVPVHYSTLSGFDTLGHWYDHYTIGLFGLAVSIINIVIARQSFHRSRIASFYLLMGAVVTAFFCLLISNAFSLVS